MVSMYYLMLNVFYGLLNLNNYLRTRFTYSKGKTIICWYNLFKKLEMLTLGNPLANHAYQMIMWNISVSHACVDLKSLSFY